MNPKPFQILITSLILLTSCKTLRIGKVDEDGYYLIRINLLGASYYEGWNTSTDTLRSGVFTKVTRARGFGTGHGAFREGKGKGLEKRWEFHGDTLTRYSITRIVTGGGCGLGREVLAVEFNPNGKPASWHILRARKEIEVQFDERGRKLNREVQPDHNRFGWRIGNRSAVPRMLRKFTPPKVR